MSPDFPYKIIFSTYNNKPDYPRLASMYFGVIVLFCKLFYLIATLTRYLYITKENTLLNNPPK
jgi:hypothetical protein